jgi:hypothetical protein
MPGVRYWDVEIGGLKLTLHSEHDPGISLFPADGHENNPAANQLVPGLGPFLEATAASQAHARDPRHGGCSDSQSGWRARDARR